MAKSPEVKLAVFGRAGVGKSGEAPLPLHFVWGRGGVPTSLCGIAALERSSPSFHLLTRAPIPPRARFDCAGGTGFIFGPVRTHPLPG